MSARLVAARALALALALFFLVRLHGGWIGGVAFSQARRHAAAGEYTEAIALLDRSAVGQQKTEAWWLAGQVRVGLWQYELLDDPGSEEPHRLLDQAFSYYTRAAAASPASGWYWSSLGEVYHQRERVERFREGYPLELVSEGRWSLVGRPGRVAVGLVRIALELEPTVHTFHDQLAYMFYDYVLLDEAVAAIGDSARVQPILRLHGLQPYEPLPGSWLEAFADASRAALGETPLVREFLHRLGLGRLEVRLENWEVAERDLRAALEIGGDRVEEAEAHYYLGLALAGQGRHDEADAALEAAQAVDVFVAPALRARASGARAAGRLEDALAHLRGARAVDPRHLPTLIQLSEIAATLGELDQAEEVLRWATVIYPDDPGPHLRLADVLAAKGDSAGLRALLEELRRLGVAPERIENLRRLGRLGQP